MGLSKQTYQERRKLGLCIQCGNEANGKSKCPTCAKKNELSRSKRTDKRKTDGLCVSCGNLARPGYATCEACSAKQVVGSLNRYYRNKAAGTCRACGKECEASRCSDCAEKFRTTQKERLVKKRVAGICLFCPQPARKDRKTCVECAKKIAIRQKESNAKLRQEVLGHYGLKCNCCGEPQIEFLEIDHIHGGGNKHRKEIGQGKIYKWLKENNWPDGFQVLCSSCNKAKARYGTCPHQLHKIN